ncbi:MAG: hypothetical protein QOE65_2922 [Solirubrobacteraceae bacterium]|nr:hypothetical protein [Solirubrobacteraceae bacterium]
MDSLAYWRRRRARLPWHRRAARREAARMAARWERRVRAAALRQADAPLSQRWEAGLLVARCALARWGRRAGIALLAGAVVTGAAAGAVLALVIQAL